MKPLTAASLMDHKCGSIRRLFCLSQDRGGETSGPKVEVVESQTEQEEGTDPGAEHRENRRRFLLEVEEEDTFNPEIILATDVHYFAKELTDFGQRIRQWQNMAMESWHFMCGRSRTHFWMKWLSGNRRH